MLMYLSKEHYVDCTMEYMKKHFAWRAANRPNERKTASWYWSIGVLAGGGALASLIVGNFLFAVLLVIGAFTIMIAGSQPPVEVAYAISDSGFHINTQIVPWESIVNFAITEDEPYVLTVATNTLFGTMSIPLSSVDHRGVRTLFLNNNIEEADSLPTFTESVMRALGL